jgi:hypothetical protein
VGREKRKERGRARKEGLRRPKKSKERCSYGKEGGICLGNNVEWVKGVFYVSLEMHIGSSVEFYRYSTCVA